MPKTSIFYFCHAPKIQKSANGFDILNNCVHPCHLLNKITFTQNKFLVIDL